MYESTECPRCGRRMSTMRNGVIRRHKDAGGNWCTGQPKVSFELMLDVLEAVKVERKILNTMNDALVTYAETITDATTEFIDQQGRTSELIKQCTARIHQEVAILQERHDSMVADVDL